MSEKRETDLKREWAMRFNENRDKYKATLNPQEYPGSMSLIYELDTRVWVVTAEGQTFVGELSSFDTFGNIVLSKAYDGDYALSGEPISSLGIIYLRAEGIMLIGQIDREKDPYFRLLDADSETVK
jgi:small nuclear ribonucleoprotein (snRNP)-like protein